MSNNDFGIDANNLQSKIRAVNESLYNSQRELMKEVMVFSLNTKSVI